MGKTIHITEDNFVITEEAFRSFILQKWVRNIGFGRMMQIISEEYQKIDPMGALTVGDCVGTMRRKRERCKREGHDWRRGKGHTWCDRCGEMKSPRSF